LKYAAGTQTAQNEAGKMPSLRNEPPQSWRFSFYSAGSLPFIHHPPSRRRNRKLRDDAQQPKGEKWTVEETADSAILYFGTHDNSLTTSIRNRGLLYEVANAHNATLAAPVEPESKVVLEPADATP
jgi:hypothetical protein